MKVAGQVYTQARCRRLLEAVKEAEEVLWQDTLAWSGGEERRRVAEQRNQIVAFMRDLEADIEWSAEDENEEVQPAVI